MVNEIVLPDNSSTEWIKLAAYIDGEGYIYLGMKDKSARVQCLHVRIGNTDPRLTNWLQATFGGKVTKQASHKHQKKVFWGWRVCGRHAAYVLENCLPHFIMKRDQAEVALAFSKLMGWKIGNNVDGRSTKPEKLSDEVIQKRAALVYKLREVRENSAERIA